MKFIYQGDIHLRQTTPVNRIDNYYETQLRKFTDFIKLADEHGADILCGGDLFDKPDPGIKIVNDITNILVKYYRGAFYACKGNHDIYFHNLATVKDTALYNLHVNGHIHILDKHLTTRGVTIHPINWEDDVVPTPIEGNYNILLGHISVFKEIPHYWTGEGYTPKTLREKFPGFDLYLCGDIHDPLVDGNVIVSGSMMRSGIDQKDFEPRCYLIEIDDDHGTLITPQYHTIEKDVFNVKEDIKPEMNLDDLVAAMKESAEMHRNFKVDCINLAKENEPAKNIIKGVFDELG
jgi:DNA repair exonuclease SbcCD nuclease subunit